MIIFWEDGPLGEVGRQLYPPAAVCSGALSLGVHGWVLNRRLCSGQWEWGAGHTVGLCPLKSVALGAGAEQVGEIS